MKQREFEKCIVCGKGVAHDGSLCFYRLKIEHMVLNVSAINRQHGLELMLGAAAPLAVHLGADEDLARPASDCTVLLCFDCAFENQVIAAIHEQAVTEAEAQEMARTKAEARKAAEAADGPKGVAVGP